MSLRNIQKGNPLPIMPSESNNNKPADVYIGLRDKILSLAPNEVGFQPSLELPNVWGVLMETGYPEAIVTLVSLADGTTSLYFSNGGGMIGGGGHPSVAEATKSFLASAEKFYPKMSLSDSYPLPTIGRVKFYVLTYSGTFTIDIDEAELGYKRDALSPLFFAGQEVITQFRIVQENIQNENK
jgi:hypothetical protein